MEILLKMIEQFSLSFLSAVGFAFIWRVPKNRMYLAGLAGAGGWMVYWACREFGVGNTVSTFWCALTIAWLSYIIARKTHTPATLYNIPGITSVVPGGTSYKMMHSLFVGDYHQAVEYGIQVIALAGAIAGGLIIFEIARRNYKPVIVTKIKKAQ